jgi:hypothetical protein
MTLINTLSENAIARISQAVGATVKADKAMTSALDTLAADGFSRPTSSVLKRLTAGRPHRLNYLIVSTAPSCLASRLMFNNF